MKVKIKGPLKKKKKNGGEGSDGPLLLLIYEKLT